MKVAIWVLVSILGIGFVVTTPVYLSLSQTFADGCFTLWNSSLAEEHAQPLFHALLASKFYPPLFCLLANISYRLHISYQTASTIFSAIVVLSAVVLALSPSIDKSASDRRLGLEAFIVYLSLPLVVGFAKIFCLDSLYLVFQPLTFLFLASFVRSRNPVFSFLCGMAFGLGMMSKWTYFLPFAIPMAYNILYRPFKSDKAKLMVSVLAFLIGGFAGGGWWYVFKLQWVNVTYSMGAQTGLIQYSYLERVGLNFKELLKIAGPIGIGLTLYALYRHVKTSNLKSIFLWLVGGVGIPLAILSYPAALQARYFTIYPLPLTIFIVSALKSLDERVQRQKLLFVIALLAVVQSLAVCFGLINSKKPISISGKTPFTELFMLEYQRFERDSLLNLINSLSPDKTANIHIYECRARIPVALVLFFLTDSRYPLSRLGEFGEITNAVFKDIKNNLVDIILVPEDCWVQRAEAFREMSKKQKFWEALDNVEKRLIDWASIDEFYDYVESNYIMADCPALHPPTDLRICVFTKRSNIKRSG